MNIPMWLIVISCILNFVSYMVIGLGFILWVEEVIDKHFPDKNLMELAMLWPLAVPTLFVQYWYEKRKE